MELRKKNHQNHLWTPCRMWWWSLMTKIGPWVLEGQCLQKKDQETAKNFLVLKAAKSYLCDWMVERSSGARWMVYIHGGLCGVHLPVVIEVKRTCQSPGVSKIMKQMNSRRSHWTYIIVHPDHPWSSVVRYQFVWTWKQSGRHCSSCCNPSSRNTSSQISTLGKKQSRLGIGFFSQNSSPTRITGHISVHFAAEKVDPKRGGPWRVGIWARWDGLAPVERFPSHGNPGSFVPRIAAAMTGGRKGGSQVKIISF